MLQVRVCGGLEVQADGRPLPDALVGGRQGRLVLAFLACERHRAVRKEELAELLWADRLPASWSASLSAVISRLRRFLGEAGLDGPAALPSVAGAYQLIMPAGARLDLDDLVAAVADAEAAAVTTDTSSAVRAAAVAEEIGARGFLTDDCDWVDRQRVLVRDLRVRAQLALGAVHLRAGTPARAVEVTRHALALDESREEAYRQLMRALAAAGERAEALRVWERCRATLVEELGVDPSPETEAVYAEVLGAVPAAAAPPAALPSGVVTFLLTDIVESTALWDHDPAAMALALERHDTLVDHVVATHGGTLLKSKLEGDATVSVFARASEAAAAALAVLDAVDAEPWPEGAEPRLRMAMHTGEAFERGGDYFGPALNRAARLRSLAGAGEVLLSQAVAELVRDHLPKGARLRDVGHRELRGLSRGENVYQLQRVVSPAASADVRTGSTPAGGFVPPALPAALTGSGPFVGRGDELALLAGLWERVGAGEPAAAFIGGEPGVGKSRLAAELATRAHGDGGVVLYGRCDEDLSAPLQPFIEALRGLIPSLGTDALRSVRGIDELARVVPELAERLPDAAPGMRADPDTERLALFDAVANLLSAASVASPVVLVLDDLHWAGKTTLSVLRHLLRSARQARLLVVGTYRDTELARTHPLASTLADLRRDAAAHRISLDGLDPEEVATYLTAVGNTDRALGRELAEVTSGNPFFLIEVLRHVEESGGTWTPETLPEGVREATGRRLSRLSDSANTALSVAAVVGTTFDLALVEQALAADLVDEVAEACGAGLVLEEPGTLGRFRFAHALVRRVLLAELVTVKRVRLHRTIAELLEAVPMPADADAHLADLAYHWFECASAGGAAQAVTACRRAADRAMERLAYEEAADLYGMALQVVDTAEDPEGEVAAALHLARCDALLTAGDVIAARAAIDGLELVARGSERLNAWYTTYEGLLAVLAEPDRLTEIVQSIGAAAEAMRAVGDLSGEAKAHYVHASALDRLGQIGAAERALDLALAAARRADDRRLADAILAEAPPAALWGPSSVTRASGRCLDVVRVLRINEGAPAVESVALRCQAVLEALRGRADAGRRMIASARRTVERLGLTHRLLETELAAGFIELLDGEAEAAEPWFRVAYEGLRGRGLDGEAAQAAAFLGRALLLQGRVDEADAVAVEAEELAGSDLKAAIAWRDVRAEVAARRGDTAGALVLAREAVDLAAATDALLLVADARLTLATVLRAAGDDDAADAEARRALEACEAKGATALAARVRGAAPDAVEAVGAQAAPPVGATANLAMAHAVRFRDAFNRGDFDAQKAGLSPDFRHVDRRPLMETELYGREANEGGGAPLVYQTGARFDPPQLVEARGERIALVRWDIRAPGAEWSYLAAMRVDSQGRQTDYVMFELDDTDGAGAELDQLVELDRWGAHPAWVGAMRFSDAVNAHDWDALLATLAPGVERLDRRSGVSVTDGLEPLEAWRTMFSLDDWSVRRTALEAAGDRRILLHEVWWFRDGEVEAAEVECLTVVAVDGDGRSERLVSFDTGDLAGAREELHRGVGHADPGIDNAAWRAVQVQTAAVNDDAPDKFFATLAPTYEYHDLRPGLRLVAAGDKALDVHRTFFALDEQRYRIELVATRGPHLALARVGVSFVAGATGPAEVDTVVVCETMPDGLIARVTVYEPEDLDAALAALDDRYVEQGGPDARRFNEALARHDWALFRSFFTPSFVAIDHRRAGFGQTDRDGFVAYNRSGAELSRQVRGSVVHVVAAGPTAALFVGKDVGVRDDGGTWDLQVISLSRFGADGLITQLDLYDLDDLDAARAEYERAAAGSVAPNEAWRASERCRAAVNRGDREAYVAQFSPGWCYDDRQPVVGAGEHYGDEALRAPTVAFGLDEFRLERRLLATRGDRLALSEERATFRDGQTGPAVVDSVTVTQVDREGLIERCVVFGPEAMAEALAELDARYERERQMPFANAVVRLIGQMDDASDRKDWDGFVAMLSPDYRHHNRRRLLQHESDDPSHFWRVMFALDEWRLRRATVATRGDRLALMTSTVVFRDGEAGPAEVQTIQVFELDAAGLLLDDTAFETDDLDTAYDHLDARFVALGGPDMRRFRAVASSDDSELGESLAPDCTVIDHRPFGFGRVDRDAFLAYNRSTRELRPEVRRTIDHVLESDPRAALLVGTDAGRSDSGDFEVTTISVSWIDADRRIYQIDLYDLADLDDARAEYQRAVRSGSEEAIDNAVVRLVAQMDDASDCRDWDAFIAALDPACEIVDRRRSVTAPLGTDAIGMFRTLFGLDEWRLRRTPLATRGENLGLFRNVTWFRDGSAGPAVVEAVTMLETGADGLLLRETAWDPEDSPAAYEALDARFAELDGSPPNRP